MRCKYCDVEVTCESKICPLCHEKLSIKDNLDLDYTPTKAYPDKQKPIKKPYRQRLTVTGIYLCISLSLFILSIPINLSTDPKHTRCIIIERLFSPFSSI